MKDNLAIDLQIKSDERGGNYYIGKLSSPIEIDCSRGVAFFIFIADPDQEQLQIAPAHANAYTNKHYFKNGKLKIKLEERGDRDREKFFLCKIREDMKISCHAGATFMVFISIKGSEELQIDAQFIKGNI